MPPTTEKLGVQQAGKTGLGALAKRAVDEARRVAVETISPQAAGRLADTAVDWSKKSEQDARDQRDQKIKEVIEQNKQKSKEELLKKMVAEGKTGLERTRGRKTEWKLMEKETMRN